MGVSVESIARVPHLKYLFYLDRKQAGGSSLLFVIQTPPFVNWRAMQHTQAVLGNKVHAVPRIWIILCHLMEVFLQHPQAEYLVPNKGSPFMLRTSISASKQAYLQLGTA